MEAFVKGHRSSVFIFEDSDQIGRLISCDKKMQQPGTLKNDLLNLSKVKPNCAISTLLPTHFVQDTAKNTTRGKCNNVGRLWCDTQKRHHKNAGSLRFLCSVCAPILPQTTQIKHT